MREIRESAIECIVYYDRDTCRTRTCLEQPVAASHRPLGRQKQIALLTLRYLRGESHGAGQKGKEGGDLEGLHGEVLDVLDISLLLSV